MKYTNKLNLPDAIVRAVTNDPYDKGESDISVTGLIAPPRIRVLRKINEAELTEDVADRIYALLGQVMHGILERANMNALAEERFYLDIEGITISGQGDIYYSDGLLQDYKLVSLYQVKDGIKPEFEQQLNALAYLMKYGYTIDKTTKKEIHHKFQVNKLENVFILRDWSKSKAKNDHELPQQQCMKLEIPLWSEEQTKAWLVERIKIHKAANKKLPECSADERWATPDKWAVMPKKNASRSLKNHDVKENAEIHAAQVKGAFVELRPGVNNRCDAYCNVSQWCTQYQKLKENK